MDQVGTKNSRDAAHRIILLAREQLEVRGVSDVISFDEQTAQLMTVCGRLDVEGDALHVRVLNTEDGTVAIEGRVDSLHYYETEPHDKKAGGFFGRLLR